MRREPTFYPGGLKCQVLVFVVLLQLGSRVGNEPWPVSCLVNTLFWDSNAESPFGCGGINNGSNVEFLGRAMTVVLAAVAATQYWQRTDRVQSSYAWRSSLDWCCTWLLLFDLLYACPCILSWFLNFSGNSMSYIVFFLKK